MAVLVHVAQGVENPQLITIRFCSAPPGYLLGSQNTDRKSDYQSNEQQNGPWHRYGEKQKLCFDSLRVLQNHDDGQDRDDRDRNEFPA